MLQLFGMVRNPYATDPETPIPPMLYNNVPKKSLGWSETLYSPEPKVATTTEIPDWTDGKVVEMIEEYKKRCAEGMTGTEAEQRKKEMLAEIEVHQVGLIKELETIHHDMGDREDTEILLAIWKKKMDTWKNEKVMKLKQNCMPKVNPPTPCTDFNTTLQEYQKKCAEMKLTPDEAQRLRDTMQDCIKTSLDNLKKFDEDINKIKYINKKAPDPTVEKEIKKQREIYNKQKEEIENQQNEFNSLPSYNEEDCVKTKETKLVLDIPFVGDKGNFKGKADDIKDLQMVVKSLQKNKINKIKLQPRTAYPKDAGGENLIKLRTATIQKYFENLKLSDQVEIIINNSSYNSEIDVIGTMTEYGYTE